MSTKISVEHVYKVFGANPQRAIERVERGEGKDEIFAATGMTVGVSDASFEVNEGEVFVVMGLSGSGKSTLVRMLNRLIEPTSGAVRIDDRDITRMNRRELIQLRRHDISMVFQSFALMPHQTVLENTVFGLSVAGMGRSERNSRALEALEGVGLKANAYSYPDELSGGMKQRVGLARALAVNPGILLMDEAFSALDPLIRTEMQNELLRLQAKQKRTVVFITHDLDEAMRVGDRIAMMEGGRIVQIGTPDEIVREPADEYVSSFFKGVDVSYVFVAGHIASREEAALIESGEQNLARVRETVDAHPAGIGVVIDGNGGFKGLVTPRSLADCDSGAGVEHAFVDDVEIIDMSEPLSGLMGRVAESAHPLVVRDVETQRYAGVISSRMLLHTLNRGRNDETNNESVSNNAEQPQTNGASV